MTKIKKLTAGTPEFDVEFDLLTKVSEEDREDVMVRVREIVSEVRKRGDPALLEFTNRFDRRAIKVASDLEISAGEMKAATDRIDPLVKEALQSSIARVRRYHEQQKRSLGDQVDWAFEDDDGNELGQRVRGMSRVGIYAPGGKASYPSTVIMTAVPAKVAEVSEIILVVPAPDGDVADVLLAAAHLCGVDQMFTVGGAQAIAALTFGTETIPRVDKIVGPGNQYVAAAKEQVFGQVGIDMIAGPSEIVIVADKSANTDWLVMDMFAQAEHDEMAQAILISDDDAILDEVREKMDRLISQMKRSRIIAASIRDRGALIKVSNLVEAVQLVNRIAPEHLELAIDAPDKLLPEIVHAGAIFVGNHTAEAMGDYCAGPSHVLPTSGTARFASPLGVYDFQVRSSLIRCSPAGAIKLGRDAAILAEEEGLEAHARSASYRVEG